MARQESLTDYIKSVEYLNRAQLVALDEAQKLSSEGHLIASRIMLRQCELIEREKRRLDECEIHSTPYHFWMGGQSYELVYDLIGINPLEDLWP